jgi:hypothetical protein
MAHNPKYTLKHDMYLKRQGNRPGAITCAPTGPRSCLQYMSHPQSCSHTSPNLIKGLSHTSSKVSWLYTHIGLGETQVSNLAQHTYVQRLSLVSKTWYHHSLTKPDSCRARRRRDWYASLMALGLYGLLTSGLCHTHNTQGSAYAALQGVSQDLHNTHIIILTHLEPTHHD